MDNIRPHLLASDFDLILKRTSGILEYFDHSSIFITGGTGFIGTWLVESLLWAQHKLDLDITISVLSRDPNRFLRSNRYLLNNKYLHFIEGDVRNFKYPKKKFTHIIHAATAASAKLNAENPLEMFDTTVLGTRNIMAFAQICGASNILQTSSGGVYGNQYDILKVTEDYSGAPSPMDPFAAYSESKRASEMLGKIYSDQVGFSHKIARITATVGPRLPLDIHFALGNFIRDGLAGRPINILGDGTPYRSYLYVGDMIAWLLTILAKGKSNYPYNVGSDHAISILETAKAVNTAFGGNLTIKLGKKPLIDGRPSRYVPSTDRAKNELGLDQWTDLGTSITKTIDWYRAMTL